MSCDDSDDDLTHVLAVAVAVLDMIDQERYTRNRTLAAWAVVLAKIEEEDALEGDDDGDAARVKRTRRVFPRADYRASAWATMLRSEDLPDPTSRAARQFRRRFRIPHPFFLELVKIAVDKKWFPSATEDVGHRPCVPVELKVGQLSFAIWN